MTRDEAQSILGASQGQSRDEVRRLYLRQLKSVRPESDPEGFQRLRQAWESWDSGQFELDRANPAITAEASPEPTGDQEQGNDDIGTSPETPLSQDDVARVLETTRVSPRFLTAALDLLIGHYDAERGEHRALVEALSRAIAQSKTQPLHRKWAFASQFFQVGPALSRPTVEALRIVLLYLDREGEMPDDLSAKLEGLSDGSVLALSLLPSPTFADYLKSQTSLRTHRKKAWVSLLKTAAATTPRVNPAQKATWIIVVVGIVLLGGLLYAALSTEKAPTPPSERAKLEAGSYSDLGFPPGTPWPSNSMLRAMSAQQLENEAARLKGQLALQKQSLASMKAGGSPSSELAFLEGLHSLTNQKLSSVYVALQKINKNP